jgi:Protein of unknown function (DUF3263)
VRSAAPIEGQLSFGVLLEEPVPTEPSETAESVAPVEPPADPVATSATSTIPTTSQDAPAAATPLPTDEAERTTSGAADERADPQDWHAILDFERGWTGSPSAKQRAVRDRFGIGSARYHQLLDRALERPEALVYDPALVGRLRRVRDTRRRKRFAQRLEVDPPDETPTHGQGDRREGRPTDPDAGQGGGDG